MTIHRMLAGGEDRAARRIVDLQCSAGSNVGARDDDALTGLLSRYRKNLLFLNMTV